MFGTALSALGDRLDTKFLTAYWTPSFVGALLGLVLYARVAGPAEVRDWLGGLDSVGQGLVTMVVLLCVTVLGFVLQALSHTVVAFFSGALAPRAVVGWMRQSQAGRQSRAARLAAAGPLLAGGGLPTAVEVQAWLGKQYPDDAAATMPTRLGNILAAATEHPRRAYLMDGLVWWPRLAAVAPAAFGEALGSAQAAMMGLLNLSVALALWAVGAAVVLGPGTGDWRVAAGCLVVGLAAANLCQRAALGQAQELGTQLRVGFDLYRHEILRQMDVDVPADPDDERALWRQLTLELLGAPDAVPAAPSKAPDSGAASA